MTTDDPSSTSGTALRMNSRWHSWLNRVGQRPVLFTAINLLAITVGLISVALLGGYSDVAMDKKRVLILAAWLLLIQVFVLLVVWNEMQTRSNRARQDLVRYVEELRDYAVSNIEPLRANLEVLQQVQVAQPPEHVSSPSTEKPLSTKERDTLLKLLYAMATAPPYGWDPTKARNEGTAIVASAAAAAGVPVDQDTVRKYLQQAAARFGRVRTIPD